MLRKTEEKEGTALVSAFCQRERERLRKNRKTKRQPALIVLCQRPVRPQTKGDFGNVNGRTPARSTAITFRLTQLLTTHMSNTQTHLTKSIKHGKFMGRRGRDRNGTCATNACR